MFEPPPVRWAFVDGTSVAYQVVGDGPVDLVVVGGIGSQIEILWEFPGFGSFMERLGQIARIIHIDKRGGGLSDRFLDYPPLEVRVRDVTAVLDQEGIDRAFLMGQSEGGAMCTLAAATVPERLLGVVLWAGFARYVRDDDYPFGMTAEALLGFLDDRKSLWGTVEYKGHGLVAPRLADNEEFARVWARLCRLAMTPTGMLRAWELICEMDTRPILGAIHVPTLVMQRVDDRVTPVGMARYLADAIPSAELIELDGDDHLQFLGNSDEVIDHLARFVGSTQPSPITHRSLATVLFIDIVNSTTQATELGDARWRSRLDEYETVVDRQLDRFAGSLTKSTGDGTLATFDGPARAIGCAVAIRNSLEAIGLTIRAGVHTGEIERRGHDIAGLAVHIAARIEAAAPPGEIAASSTVKDLIAGSGVALSPLGAHQLKGVPGTWDLHQITTGPTTY